MTRRLYEHALARGELNYDSRSGIKTVSLDWHLPEAQADAPSEQMVLFE